MQTFLELLEAKVTPDLVKTTPHAPGERRFANRHTIKDILASFRQAGNDEMFNGKIVKVFDRKKNHFGNDTVDSIKAYESENLEENFKEGDRVIKTMGVKLKGKIIKRKGDKSTDHLKNQKDYYSIKWDDGSEGNYHKHHLQNESENLEERRIPHVINKGKRKFESKKKHVYINGKWVGTTTYSKSNKEALHNYVQEHPGTHISKLKIAQESEINELSTGLLNRYVNKAADNMYKMDKEHVKDANYLDKKYEKRTKGIKTADSKIHEETAFDKLKNKIKKKEGYSEEGAAGLAAKIGREKLGKKAFQKKAEEGKKKVN